jgi:hypothetical protein
MIDITKKYKTRDGRAVTGLRYVSDPGAYPYGGRIAGCDDEQAWDHEGKFYNHSREPDRRDLVLVDEPEKPVPGLLTPDPLRTEYGIFVAAVKANFAAGTFATATQDQFDQWLESLTQNLRA